MPTTGPVSWKRYKCSGCGHEENYNTNHYGSIYCRCGKCSWKSPMDPIKVFKCLEPLPEGWELPPEWKMVKLGDIIDKSE